MDASTRDKIINFLLAHPESSAAEISAGIDFSKSNIQYHLKFLLKAREIIAIKSSTLINPGRPVLYYSVHPPVITGSPGRLLDAFLSVFLSEYDANLPSILEKLAACLYPVNNLISNQTLRMQNLIRLISSEGYTPRWEVHINGPRVIFLTCPYAAVVNDYPAICALDQRILERLSAGRVIQEKWISPGKTGSICQFQILFSKRHVMT